MLINFYFFQIRTYIFILDNLSKNLCNLNLFLLLILILICFNEKIFYWLLILISVFSIHLLFITNNFILFFFFYESTLIPMFILIGVYGSRYEKIKAAYYFFFYTFIGSILLFLTILKIYYYIGSYSILNLKYLKLPLYLQYYFFIGCIFSFAVKVPMIPFHIWLPQAHVEAPISGSILLAGILLKLGGYGIIRIGSLFYDGLIFFQPIFIILSIISIIYGGILTIRQNDIKRLIAYSSVSHMGFVTLSFFIHNIISINGSLIIMISHGYISSALFLCAHFIYFRLKTRNLIYILGINKSMPIFSILFFIILLGNISFPMTLNFIGEIIIIMSIIKLDKIIIISICLGMLLGTIYSIYLFNRILGKDKIKYIRDLNRLEIMQIIPLIIITYYYGIFFKFFPNIIFI